MCFESLIQKPAVSFFCRASHLKDARKHGNYCCGYCFLPSYIALEESWPVQGRIEEEGLMGKFNRRSKNRLKKIALKCVWVWVAERIGSRNGATTHIFPKAPPPRALSLARVAQKTGRSGIRKYSFLGDILGSEEERSSLATLGLQLGIVQWDCVVTGASGSLWNRQFLSWTEFCFVQFSTTSCTIKRWAEETSEC